MRFINGDEADLHISDDIQEFFVMEPFRSDVDKLDGSFSGISDFLKNIALFLERYGRIDTNRSDSLLSELIDLILHKGNKWGNDNSDSGQSYSRNLICETLSTAGRHKYESIVSRDNTFDNIFLSLAKARETKGFSEDVINIWSHGRE